jgi:solute carrier family 35 protein
MSNLTNPNLINDSQSENTEKTDTLLLNRIDNQNNTQNINLETKTQKMSHDHPDDEISRSHKIGSALFYGASSFLIMNVNKAVLTTHHFPSANVLALSQISSTVIILFVLKLFRVISYPDAKVDVLKKIFPLPMFYLGNLCFGLLGTQGLSLPMQTALRRFSILLTMVLEMVILKKRQESKIIICVLVMVFGSCIAASHDLAFNLIGYAFVMANNLCTASQGVYVKKKLQNNDLGKLGLLFYNSLICYPVLLMIVSQNGDMVKVRQFQGWGNMIFTFEFLTSCVMGLVLNFSIFLCTQYNSALVTTVIGCLKNILITYLGILFPTEDYIFSWINFGGLTISIIGSIFFSYYTFSMKGKAKEVTEMNSEKQPLVANSSR